jgi:hypothetical protein
MKAIEELAEHISEELDDAEEYIKLALHYKDTDSKLADTYARLSQEEINHSEHLHAQAVRLIEAHRAAGHTLPAAMVAVWDWEHKKSIDHKARVKSLIEMYKN